MLNQQIKGGILSKMMHILIISVYFIRQVRFYLNRLCRLMAQ